MPRKPVKRPDKPGERDGLPLLTVDGREQLLERARDIRERRLPELRPLLVGTERDERDVAEFERLLAEADALEALVGRSVALELDPAAFDGRVGLGMRVRVRINDEDSWVRPVHPDEAFLDDERISATSPLAIALVGARVGHTVWVDAPTGAWPCEVLDVDHPATAPLG